MQGNASRVSKGIEATARNNITIRNMEITAIGGAIWLESTSNSKIYGHFKDDEFEVTTATTVDEAKQILSSGFDYITEKNGIMLFRRPKRFRGSINA